MRLNSMRLIVVQKISSCLIYEKKMNETVQYLAVISSLYVMIHYFLFPNATLSADYIHPVL